MRLSKRLASVLVTTMVLSSMPQVVWANDYENHWAAQAINKWKDKGVINGFEDGSFRPKEVITKAQFTKILVEIFGYSEVEGAKQYKDVSTDKWYSEYISKISAAGVMYEVGETFNPNVAITREEATYALAHAYKMTNETSSNKTFNDQEQISDWALEAVIALYDAGYIKGTPEGNFNPKGSLTRAEVVTMIDRINSEVINVKGSYSQNIAGNLVVNTRDVVLKDMTIKGNLYLAEGIGDGDIDLENVIVEGKVFVEGGGINSIKSKNCKYYENIQVSAKNPVRVVIEGEGVKIEALEGTQVTLTGSFKEVTVAPNVNMTIKDAKVDVVVIAKGTKNEGAAPKIEIAAGTTVGKIQADIAATLTGSGKVTELIANANNVKIEQKPDKVTIGEKDVTVNVAGKDQSQSTTTQTPSTSKDGSSSSHSNSSSDSLAPTYRVSGIVSAQQKAGEQLKDVAEGAMIEIYEVTNQGNQYIKTVYTDENGAYSVNLGSGKTYRIEAWLNDGDNNGYFYSGKISTLTQNLNGYNFTLDQYPVANITVVDENDHPIKDVKIVPVMDGKEDGWSYTGYTGNEIRYLWGDDETTFNFNVYLADVKVEPSTVIKDITVGEVKEKYGYRFDLKVELPFTIPSTVTGKLVSESGEVFKNYPVSLVRNKYSLDHGSKWVSEVATTTDSEGVFTFENIDTNLAEDEYYTLSVSSRDENGNSYNADNRSQSLYALQANGNQIKLQQTYGVVVKVIDKDGKPVRDADVELSATTSNGNYGYSTNTNYQGIADIHATYIEPINNTLVVEYKGQAVVTNVQMTEGNYNYETVVQLDNISISGKMATIKLADHSVTVGDQTITASQVCIEGSNGDYWSDIDSSGEAVIILPEDYNKDLKLYVVGSDGETIYRDKIDILDNQFSQTIKLSDVPKYTVSGELRVVTTSQSYTVTTGASISVNTNGNFFGNLGTPIATSESTESGYTQSNLVSSASYIVTARYEKEGKKYIGRRTLFAKDVSDGQVEDRIENINLAEATEVSIKFQDNNRNVLSNAEVYVNNERFRTNNNGYLTYEMGIGEKVNFYVSGNNTSGNKYKVKQIVNEANNTVIDSDSIKLEKDANLIVVVE